MAKSDEIKLAQILDFKNVILKINEELKLKGIYDCEYMLINNSVEDVFRVLEDQSDYYNIIKDDRYDSNITFKGLLESYFIVVKQYYEKLLIEKGESDFVADKYYRKLVEPVKEENGNYLIYDKSNIDMSLNEIQKTLLLMKEAVQTYYKVYNNKELIAELTANNPDLSEYFIFQIKEEQLLHLLGVNIKQLKENPDFQRLTGNKKMGSMDILRWILTDIDGNCDLLQYSEDFLNKILSTKNFEVNVMQRDANKQLLNYHKIRTKSQTLLKYGPFEKVSLVAKLGKNNSGKQKTLSRNSKSTVAMISRAETFKKYPWAYFGLVNGKYNQYVETLQIDSSENKKDLFRHSKPAIIKKIGFVCNGDGDGSNTKIFSEEEQFDLFVKAYDAFKDTMDFTNLINYFKELSEKLNIDMNFKLR